MRSCPACGQSCSIFAWTCSGCGAELRQGGKESGAAASGVGLIIVVAILWEIYRAFIRALFALPHWLQIILWISVGAAISYGLLSLIKTIYRGIRKRPMTRKASLIVFVAIVTSIVPNLLTPSVSAPPGSGPTNSAIIDVPSRGLSHQTGMSGTTVFVQVLPKDSVWIFLNQKRIDLKEYKPHVFDELRFISRTGKPLKICVAQFSYLPTQRELDARPAPCTAFRP